MNEIKKYVEAIAGQVVEEIKTRNRRNTAHKTGWLVWVGGESRWFRSHDRAATYCALRQRQYGSAVVTIQAAGQ